MKKDTIVKVILLAVMISLAFSFLSCEKKEKPKEAKAPVSTAVKPTPQEPVPAAGAQSSISQIHGPLPQVAGDLVVEVNGVKLTKKKLDADVESKIKLMEGQIPADKIKKVRPMVRQRLIEDFVVRTILAQEIKRRGLKTSEKETDQAIESMKRRMPPGMSIEELMKKNNITQKAFREEVQFGIEINKMVLASMTGKGKPTEKEVEAYYTKNKEKFKEPETVRVRHILISKAASDDEKLKNEKKAKAESIRKQLLEGGDFAELAKKYSDCPSKDKGGDLGIFPRGQMVKPFEDAAFSQKKNEIGPVVETEFGYHIIQVIDKYPPQTTPLNDNLKNMISNFLMQQKQQQAFEALVNKLRQKAVIAFYEKPQTAPEGPRKLP
jgi:peptidyl-prolyl cis-trans isomerase C